MSEAHSEPTCVCDQDGNSFTITPGCPVHNPMSQKRADQLVFLVDQMMKVLDKKPRAPKLIKKLVRFSTYSLAEIEEGLCFLTRLGYFHVETPF